MHYILYNSGKAISCEIQTCLCNKHIFLYRVKNLFHILDNMDTMQYSISNTHLYNFLNLSPVPRI